MKKVQKVSKKATAKKVNAEKPKINKYTEARKKVVLGKVHKGMSQMKVAKMHNIPRSTVWNWCRQAKISKGN
jgi:DNA-directed RNA polymerase specialized sigma24 family protein